MILTPCSAERVRRGHRSHHKRETGEEADNTFARRNRVLPS
jgi:hypothetical protein